MSNSEQSPRPEPQFRVRGRRLAVGDKVYEHGELIPASELGQQAGILISNRLIARVHEVDALSVPPRGFWARVRNLFSRES
ncbi:MAG: hypothetical protein ACAH95_08440 [Fimbriimonas sp.]